MTAVLTRQYRPLATTDTAGDDALSVRDIRELGDGLNNFKAHMAGKMYGRLHGGVGGAQLYPWKSPAASSAENVVDFVTRPLAVGHNAIIFQIGGLMGGLATGTCTWKLYASTQRYSGPKLFDVTYLGSVYAVSTGILISTSTHECPPAVANLVALRDQNGDCHLTLTSQNTVAHENDFCRLSSIAASPKVII